MLYGVHSFGNGVSASGPEIFSARLPTAGERAMAPTARVARLPPGIGVGGGTKPRATPA